MQTYAEPAQIYADSGETIQKSQNYTKLNVGEDQQQYVRYASQISDNDLHFLATLEAENGLWSHDRISTLVGSNGYRDRGFCQVNPGYHPGIFYDERFLSDPYWQLDKCYELYLGGTTFYGKRRLEAEPDFKDLIYSRFELQ
jgi:hypothetical protein